MSNDAEIFAALNYIKNKVDSIEKIDFQNLKSNASLRKEYTELLTGDKVLFNVYTAVDGMKNQKSIADGVHTSEMTVSRKLGILFEHGLIEVKCTIGKQIIYQHSIIEKAFHLVRIKI